MKKLPFLVLIFALVACHSEKKSNSPVSEVTNTTTEATATEANFSVNTTLTESLTHNNLRLYPIEATAEHIAAHSELANFKNLAEAIELNGFHITERKPYGRFDDVSAVNSLTVQNKSQDTIYLMAGDVLKGGNQDRLIAQDLVVPPRTLTNVAVFCVEQNRWEAIVPPGEEQKASSQKHYAFSGYYNVASNEIRKAAIQTQNQQEIWAKVGEWTAFHKATSKTGSYTALENASDYTELRDEYLHFFQQRMDLNNNTIGIIAVSGDQILGTDIFNHPALFKKQLPALLHAYVTDAITKGKAVGIDKDILDRYIKKMMVNYEQTLSAEKEKETKFRYNDKIVHFSYLQ